MSVSTSAGAVSSGQLSTSCGRPCELRSGKEPGLTGIGTTPKFGIGQRALLVQSPGGNVLWDCISLLDDATVEAVQPSAG